METQKVWFITGASKGFGLEIVKAALHAGDKVVATVRTGPRQLSVALGNPVDLFTVQMDVTFEEDVRTAVRQAMSHFGKIDVLVNNAGFGMLTAIEEASDREARKLFDTNVFGLLNVTRAVLPYMRRERSGRIVNISSLFGYDAIPGWGLYGATKFAVEGISVGLSLELAPFGIFVTAVAPGLFSTNFLGKGAYSTTMNIIADYEGTAVGQMRKTISGLHGKQPGDPKKLAELIVKLANSEKPPVHLPVGKDAIAMYRKNAEKTAREIDEWEELSSATGHDSKN